MLKCNCSSGVTSPQGVEQGTTGATSRGSSIFFLNLLGHLVILLNVNSVHICLKQVA